MIPNLSPEDIQSQRMLAKKYGVTRRRVQQLEHAALSKTIALYCGELLDNGEPLTRDELIALIAHCRNALSPHPVSLDLVADRVAQRRQACNI